MVNGENQSISILVSSAQYDSSFTNQRIQETEGDPHTYIVNARSWDVKPQNYSKERFYVFTGSGELDPMILETIAEINSILDSFGLNRLDLDLSIKDAIEYLPSEIKNKIVDVPIDFYKDFKQNLLQSIQDIAGMTISGQGKLFNNKEVFKKAIYEPEESAFLKDTFTISTKLETRPQDFINPRWKPEKPEKLRFMHLDQGISSDHYGLSSCFIDHIDINEDETVSIHVKFDFILNIVPPRPPAKVDISKVRSLIPWLSQNKGINWGMITYDQFQSQESMQELDKAGFPVSYQSVDKTDEAYLLLVDYLYDERVKLPYNEEFEFDLFNLVHFRERRKVDHTCLTGDTKVSLVDGRELTILELLDEQSKGKINWVYSFNEQTKKIEPKPIEKVLETKIVNKYVDVLLDNDEHIYCTLDHKFMTRDGNFIEAQHLTEGQSLMPLYRKYSNSKKSNNYRKYYEPMEEKWYFEYKNFCLDDFFEGSIVHHLNYNTFDNTPTNLKRMTKSDHIKLHNNSTKDNYKLGRLNHKVKSINIIEVAPTQMYDLSIKDNHNFALTSGVFVHNSTGRKDVSDSVAGSLYNAIKSDYFQKELVENDVDILFEI